MKRHFTAKQAVLLIRLKFGNSCFAAHMVQNYISLDVDCPALVAEFWGGGEIPNNKLIPLLLFFVVVLGGGMVNIAGMFMCESLGYFHSID